MVSGAYRDLFIAIAGAAGALTGLLFVALSVAPRPRTGQRQDVIRQVRAAAALLAFTNALAVSLFGLVPHNEIGYPAALFGVIGVLSPSAGCGPSWPTCVARTQVRGQIGLVVLLLAAFGVEVVAGVISIARPHGTVAIDVIGNVLAASLLIGIARSWELVGERDYGITSSLLALAGHERHLGGAVAGPADVPPDDSGAAGEPAGPAAPGAPAGPGAPGGPAGRSAPGG